MKTSISQRIREGLEINNIKQIELASKTGISRSAISSYIAGRWEPKQSAIFKIAKALNVSEAWLMGFDVSPSRETAPTPPKGVKIPILGEVVAGVPIESIENVIGYEEISERDARGGEFFALVVKGASMEPRIFEGDVVIVRKQPTCEHDDVCVVLINGDEATIKRVRLATNGITLVAYNAFVYPSQYYSNEDIASLPVTIVGKVVELRRKM